MIQPINSINYSKNTNFKAFYDPTCPNIPASLKASAKDSTEHFIDSAKETILHGIPSKMKKVLETDSDLQILDGRNIVNTRTGVAVHFTPDGMPITYAMNNAPETQIPDAPISGNITALDGSNLIDGSGNLTHIMPDGTPFTTGLDLPDDGGAVNTILDILDTFS